MIQLRNTLGGERCAASWVELNGGKHVGRHIKKHKHAPAFVSFINSFFPNQFVLQKQTNTHTHRDAEYMIGYNLTRI